MRINFNNPIETDPKMQANVLSVSCILYEGFAVCFTSSGCRIMKGEEVILTGERKGALFVVRQG